MKCKDIQPLLSLHVDGACSAEEEAQVRSHLEACGDCTELLRELRKTAELVAVLPELRISASFQAQLGRRLRAVAGPESPRESVWTWLREGFQTSWVRWPAVAVATAVVLLIGLNSFGLLRWGRENGTRPPATVVTAAPSVDDYLAAAAEIHSAYESVAQPLAVGAVFCADNGDQ